MTFRKALAWSIIPTEAFVWGIELRKPVPLNVRNCTSTFLLSIVLVILVALMIICVSRGFQKKE